MCYTVRFNRPSARSCCSSYTAPSHIPDSFPLFLLQLCQHIWYSYVPLVAAGVPALPQRPSESTSVVGPAAERRHRVARGASLWSAPRTISRAPEGRHRRVFQTDAAPPGLCMRCTQVPGPHGPGYTTAPLRGSSTRSRSRLRFPLTTHYPQPSRQLQT